MGSFRMPASATPAASNAPYGPFPIRNPVDPSTGVFPIPDAPDPWKPPRGTGTFVFLPTVRSAGSLAMIGGTSDTVNHRGRPDSEWHWQAKGSLGTLSPIHKYRALTRPR